MEKKKSIIEIINDTDFIGYLNGDKCPVCYGGLLENNRGDLWCSNIDCSYGVIGNNKEELIQQKYWNYHLMQANKGYKNVLASYCQERERFSSLSSDVSDLMDFIENLIDIEKERKFLLYGVFNEAVINRLQEVFDWCMDRFINDVRYDYDWLDQRNKPKVSVNLDNKKFKDYYMLRKDTVPVKLQPVMECYDEGKDCIVIDASKHYVPRIIKILDRYGDW